MSYILDALRRAEAERQRGAVPGLHAQPAFTALADAGLGPQADVRKPWRRAALAAALVGVSAGAVWWLKPAAPLPAAPERPAAVLAIAPPASLAPAPAALRPVTLAPPLSGGSVGVTTLPAPGIAPAPPALPPTPAPTPAAVAAKPPVPVPAPAPARAAAAETSAPAAPPPTSEPPPAARGASAPAARLPTLAELPEALRRELQPLSLGGSVFADQPAQRIVIVNGQVFHEGDRLNGDLQVQEIRLKSVVFSLRGQRFEMLL